MCSRCVCRGVKGEGREGEGEEPEWPRGSVFPGERAARERGRRDGGLAGRSSAAADCRELAKTTAARRRPRRPAGRGQRAHSEPASHASAVFQGTVMHTTSRCNRGRDPISRILWHNEIHPYGRGKIEMYKVKSGN